MPSRGGTSGPNGQSTTVAPLLTGSGNAADVLLLDRMMPEMDGFQVVAEMQKHPSRSQIPVIVITARDLTAEDHARLNSGIELVLLKETFSPTTLIACVRQVVAKSRRSQKIPEIVS